MYPIFVFGTGRCGSTHIQRLITLSTSCWVWGEHEGFLAPLLDSVRRYETGAALDRNVFSAGWRSDDQLISDMSLGSHRLSWLNRFDKEEFRSEVASVVDRLFRPRIPQGWTEWGFKEILYGLDNNAPATLMRLFPTATAIFTFRDPKSTIQSMIRTWSHELLAHAPSPDSFSKIYKLRARRWKVILEYFLDYRARSTHHLFFMSADKLNLPVTSILETLGLPFTRSISGVTHITNPGPYSWPDWARDRFDELFANDECKCLDLFARAYDLSNADFGVRAPS
jgi:hypothetical protein